MQHLGERAPEPGGRRPGAQVRERRGRRSDNARGIEQPAARDTAHATPGIAAIAFDRAHGRDHGPVEPGPRRELFGEPSLPGARIALDDGDHRLPLGLTRIPGRRQLGQLVRASDERRTTRLRCDWCWWRHRPPLLPPDALRQGCRRRIRLGGEFGLETRGEPLKHGECPRSVARERERPHRRPECRFRPPIKLLCALQDIERRCYLAGCEQLLGVPHAHVDRATAPVLALRREPVVELRGALDAEPLQELPLDERSRPAVVPCADERVERVEIEGDGAGRNAHLRGVRLQAVTDRLPQDTHGFVERPASGPLGLLAPQEPDQVVARPGPLRGAGEVDQECEMLVPRQRARRDGTVHAHLYRAERAAGDHAAALQRSVTSERAALSARAR